MWQPHWLTEPQIAALLHTADGDDPPSARDRTLLMLGLFAGLRTGELTASAGATSISLGLIEIVGKADKPGTACIPPAPPPNSTPGRTPSASSQARTSATSRCCRYARSIAPGGM